MPFSKPAYRGPFSVVGILNITPDSFSDGGLFLDEKKAIFRLEQLINDGADLIDIGAASSRPGSVFVSPEEEIRRLKPVLDLLFRRFSIPISLDTFHCEVAEFGLSRGVSWINDITGLTYDSRLGPCIARYGAGVMLMHMQGTPLVMQDNPSYGDVLAEVFSFLKSQSEYARDLGIEKIIVDPGIGFGKNLDHNLGLIASVDRFLDLGYPVMLGPSRKQFIGAITGADVSVRLGGTIAACLLAYQKGVQYFRVHDPFEIKQALDVMKRLMEASK